MDDILARSRAVLETTPVRWVTLIKSLPDELLNRPPAAGEWSAVECFLHLLDTERWVFSPAGGSFVGRRGFSGVRSGQPGDEIQP